MKTLIALSFLIIFGWVAVVTFAGPDLARFIDRVLPDEPVKAKVVNRRHR
jgi:hypothetical protein